MATISTHVLDSVRGAPAAGLTVVLQAQDGAELASVVTDGDGRIGDVSGDDLPTGVYRVVFGSGAYFAARQMPTFHPEVIVSISITEHRHYHVPLLLAPYAYTTYRGT